MEEIEKRLKDATESCLQSYAEWAKNKKESKTREALMEAVHELRKVAARLEIEIAISERDEMAAKPIPIPPHRSSKRRRQEDDNDNAGNTGPDAQGDGGGHSQGRPQRRRMGNRDSQ